MKNKNLIIVAIIALVVGGGAGFFGGMQYQKGQTPARGQFVARRFGGANSTIIRGQVLSKDSNSVTVKLQDGSTKIVILSNSTTVAKSSLGTADDIANGNNITVVGTSNSDGSVTAADVQVGNLGMFGPRGNGTPSASTAPTPKGY